MLVSLQEEEEAPVIYMPREKVCEDTARSRHQQAMGRTLRTLHLDFGLLVSRSMGNKVLLFKLPISGDFLQQH
jgi:hypothetical protein